MSCRAPPTNNREVIVMEFVRVSLIFVYVLLCSIVAARTPQKRSNWVVDDDGCRTPNKGVGSCQRISECKTMLEFLKSKNTFTVNEQRALQAYRCGWYSDEPKVCCPSEPIDLGWTVEEDRCISPDGASGICVGIRECKIFYNYIDQNIITDEIKLALMKYRCGLDPSDQKVCCPSKLPPIFNKNRITDLTKHPNYNLLPEQCGSGSANNKITNGNITNLLEFPWAVALKYDKKINPWSCGASLISERYVLTAAHCIRSKYVLTTARLGEHNFTSNPDCEDMGSGIKYCANEPEDFDVSIDDAIVHPGYDNVSHHNDIALIRLPRPANISFDGAAPICLPITGFEKSKLFSNYTVIGWGATETGFGSPVLLKVLVPRVENEDCAPNYAPKTILTDKQLCAGGQKEQDSCLGDSGGPLMADNTFDGRFKTTQYGIVSLGPRICGREGFPAVYTRVDKYTDWILDNIKP